VSETVIGSLAFFWSYIEKRPVTIEGAFELDQVLHNREFNVETG
jgi:hypothetical protein